MRRAGLDGPGNVEEGSKVVAGGEKFKISDTSGAYRSMGGMVVDSSTVMSGESALYTNNCPINSCTINSCTVVSGESAAYTNNCPEVCTDREVGSGESKLYIRSWGGDASNIGVGLSSGVSGAMLATQTIIYG